MNKIYKSDDKLRILIGDTLPEIVLEVLTLDNDDNIVSSGNMVQSVNINYCISGSDSISTKAMDSYGNGVYKVIIDNTVTKNWEEGDWVYWFKINTVDGKEYIRQGGIIEVRKPNSADSYNVELGGDN